MRALITTVFLFLTAISTNAGVLYLELPEDIPLGTAISPNETEKAMIDRFVINEVNKTDSEGADRIVIVTKNGEPVPAPEERELNATGKGYPYFVEGQMGIASKGWDASEWTSIREHYEAAYPYIEEVFGAPIVSYLQPSGYRMVTVAEDYTLENEWGMYVIYGGERPDTIWLKEWPLGPPSIDSDTTRAHFTRNMLHAFRWKAAATWDQFGAGIAHAAWLEIQKRLAEEKGMMLNFNDLYHMSQDPDNPDYMNPEYPSLELYNVPEMATGLADFFSPNSNINPKIKQLRYGACGYCWWKIQSLDPGFIKAFNQGLTAEWNTHCGAGGPLWTRPSYEDLTYVAEDAFNPTKYVSAGSKGGIPDWIEEQPILSNKITHKRELLVVMDRNDAQVFSYLRRAQGVPDEGEYEYPSWGTAHINFNAWHDVPFIDGRIRDFDVPLDEGFGTVNDVPMRADVQRFVAHADYSFMGDEINKTNYVYGGKMEDSIPGDPYFKGRKDFYGVISLPSNAGAFLYGTLHVEEPSTGNSADVNVRAGAFNEELWEGFGEEPTVLECEFFPQNSGGWAGIDKSSTVICDVGDEKGTYGSFRLGKQLEGYVDVNNNGIDDEEEKLLMERFKPVVQMHGGNKLHPCRVEVSLHHGTLTLWHFNIAGEREIWDYSRITPENVEEVFETYNFEAHSDPFYEYTLTFGSNEPDDVTHKSYWWNTWEQIQTQGDIYDNAATYANVFREEDMIIIQYWFYYPFNDWANNHEGDWEHINVVLSNTDPNYSEIVKVLYYFHKHYSERSSGQVEKVAGTHPKVYVGGAYVWGKGEVNTKRDIRTDKTKTADTAIGEYSPVFDSNIPDNTSVFDDEEADDYGNCSGGSYWKLGHYPNAGEWGADENVNGGGVVYSDFDVYPDNNIDLIYLHFEQDVSFGSKFWRDFPGGWGRPGAYLHMNLAMDAPLSPYWHECFEIYKASGYENYDFSPKGPNGNTENNTSNSSPAFPFALHQTYPNPAKSGSVNFAFSVPDNCRATLSVFDITGRKVAVPFDEKIVPGEYSTGLSTTSLPAGVYIYKLEAGDDIAVKKMIITR